MLNTPFEFNRGNFRPACAPALPAGLGITYPPSRSLMAGYLIRRQHGAIFRGALAHFRESFRSWRHRVHARRLAESLSRLDDHLLRDVGLSRAALNFGALAALFQY